MQSACPECGRWLSVRTSHCTSCGAPVEAIFAEHRVRETRARSVGTRVHLKREVDCPLCDARGFRKHENGSVSWCAPCAHTGRQQLCRDVDGFFAVAEKRVEAFIAGRLHPDDDEHWVTDIGPTEPRGHRFPSAVGIVKDDTKKTAPAENSPAVAPASTATSSDKSPPNPNASKAASPAPAMPAGLLSLMGDINALQKKS